MIELNQVGIRIDGLSILENVSLKIEENNIYVLFGENGSGKTTLMKTIAGMMPIDAGTIHKNPAYTSGDFIYIGDEPILYDELTGKEHIDFCYSLFRSSFDKDEIGRMAALFQIDVHLTKKVKDYSLGMKKKLQLLCVFISEARVLLLDEFISGLDVYSLELIEGILKEFAAKEGHAIIFCSHILEFSERVGNVFLQISGGRITDQFDGDSIQVDQNRLKDSMKPKVER